MKEKGVEAAAATAIVMNRKSAFMYVSPPTKTIPYHVNHPFYLAILSEEKNSKDDVDNHHKMLFVGNFQKIE